MFVTTSNRGVHSCPAWADLSLSARLLKVFAIAVSAAGGWSGLSSRPASALSKRADTGVITLDSTGNGLSLPSVAPVEGGFAALWQDGDEPGLKLQRIHSDGFLLGGALSVTASHSELTCGKVLGFGEELIVIWQDDSQTKLFRHRYALGVPFTSLGPTVTLDGNSLAGVRTTTGDFCYVDSSLGVTRMNENSYAVVWSRTRLAPYFQIFNATDAPLSPQIALGSNMREAKVAAHGDRIAMVYAQGRIFGRIYNATGALVVPTFPVSFSGTTLNFRPEVNLVRAGDDFIATWLSAGGGSTARFYGQRFSTAGGLIGGPISFDLNSRVEGSAITSALSGFFVVLSRNAGTYGQQYLRNGSAFGDESAIAGGGASAVHAVASSGNRLMTVWRGRSIQGRIIDLIDLPTFSPTTAPSLAPTAAPTVTTALPSTTQAAGPTVTTALQSTTQAAATRRAVSSIFAATPPSPEEGNGGVIVGVIVAFVILILGGGLAVAGGCWWSRRRQTPTAPSDRQLTTDQPLSNNGSTLAARVSGESSSIYGSLQLSPEHDDMKEAGGQYGNLYLTKPIAAAGIYSAPLTKSRPDSEYGDALPSQSARQ